MSEADVGSFGIRCWSLSPVIAISAWIYGVMIFPSVTQLVSHCRIRFQTTVSESERSCASCIMASSAGIESMLSTLIACQRFQSAASSSSPGTWLRP